MAQIDCKSPTQLACGHCSRLAKRTRTAQRWAQKVRGLVARLGSTGQPFPFGLQTVVQFAFCASTPHRIATSVSWCCTNSNPTCNRIFHIPYLCLKLDCLTESKPFGAPLSEGDRTVLFVLVDTWAMFSGCAVSHKVSERTLDLMSQSRPSS